MMKKQLLKIIKKRDELKKIMKKIKNIKTILNIKNKEKIVKTNLINKTLRCFYFLVLYNVLK